MKQNKEIIIKNYNLIHFSCIAIILLFLLSGCPSATTYPGNIIEPVTDVTLNKSTLTLAVDQREQMTAIINPTDKSVTWTTSDSTVATVSSKGLVTAIKAGNAQIYIRANNSSIEDSCTISVLGGESLLIRPIPTASKIFINSSPTNTRIAFGIGLSLPYNTWTPWEILNTTPIWFPFIAEANVNYTINWDDNVEGSITNNIKTYSSNILVGAYLADKVTRVSNWSDDMDSGYSTAKIFSVSSSRLIYLKVIPYSILNTGSFALKVSADGATNPDQSFTWYKDGDLITGETDYEYFFDISSLAAGTHNFTVIGSRGGISFSETYSLTK